MVQEFEQLIMAFADEWGWGIVGWWFSLGVMFGAFAMMRIFLDVVSILFHPIIEPIRKWIAGKWSRRRS